MSEILFSVALVIAFIITAQVLYSYANWRKHNVLVTASSLIAWYFSVLMIFILPLDVSLTFYEQCLTDLKLQYAVKGGNSTNTTSPLVNNQSGNGLTINSSEFNRLASEKCPEPFSYVSRDVLVTFWAVVYWTLMCLTWTVLTITQSYANSGEFTVLGKLKRVLIENAIYYGSFAFLFAICLLFIATRTDMFQSAGAGEKLITLCAAAGNTWGLFLVVLFLGYGLVEVPMRFWNEANLSRTLRRTYYRIAQLNLQRAEIEDRYATTLRECVALVEQIPASNLPSDDRRRRFVRIIAMRLPTSSEIDQLVNMRTLDRVDFDNLTESRLVGINTRLIATSQQRARTIVLFNEAVETAIRIETILSAARNRLQTLNVRLNVRPSANARRLRKQQQEPASGAASLKAKVRSVRDSFTAAFRGGRPLSVRADTEADTEALPTDERAQLIGSEASLSTADGDFEAEVIRDDVDALHETWTSRWRRDLRNAAARASWAYHCVARTYVMRALGILTAALSVIVVWSECTFSVQDPTLSLLAILVGASGSGGHYVFTQITSFGTLAYLSACTYYTVFQLKLFDYFHLVRAHQTDENSVIFSATLFARLTPALCLNYLGLIHLDTHVTHSMQQNRNDTAYTQVMGHLDVLTFLADGFNVYFPILICLLCIGTYLKLGTRLMHYFGFPQFLDNASDDELQQELIDEGSQVVRRKVERDAKHSTRTANVRFTASTSSNQLNADVGVRSSSSMEINQSRTTNQSRSVTSDNRSKPAVDSTINASQRAKMSSMIDAFDDAELSAAQTQPATRGYASSNVPSQSQRRGSQTGGQRGAAGPSWPPSIFDDV